MDNELEDIDIDNENNENNENNEIINEPQQDANNEIINEPAQDNNEENEDSDYNILPDANFSTDMVNLTAYKQKVNDSIYENKSIKYEIDIIKNDDKVVELSWKKPFMNGYITKLQSEIVSDSPQLTEEQQNNNTKNSYYIEALNNHREYYLINKNDEFVSVLTSSIILFIRRDSLKSYIDQKDFTVELEKIEHDNFKNKHPDILFYNHVSHNIVIKWNNGNTRDDKFLNHIETKGKTILFTFVTCKVNDELYDEYIKPKFITESYIKSNEMDIDDGSESERQSKYYFFNINFLVTFLPLLKFLPRDILPFAIARANALKYTFENQPDLNVENQPDLNDIMFDDEATKQNKTLQHGIMELFLLIKDNIYPYYRSYPYHTEQINSRIFQIIEWAATVSNAKVTVISKNMEKQNKKPMYNYTGTGENNKIISEPVKKTTDSMDNECPVERKPISEDGEQTEEKTYENLNNFYSTFNSKLLDHYPDLYVLQDRRYQPDPFRKLPSLRQLSRLISTIFCLYLLLNDKGYASVSGGDLFRYLLYDEIKTSADLDYVFWLNDINDKEEIIYKLTSSLVTLIAFLQSALYFTDLKHFIEFDMFYSPDKSYKFIIEINGKGDHNKFTMRTMNNPDKFPVTLLSVDCNLKKEMYFIANDNEYTKFKTNIVDVDEKENEELIINLYKSTYLSSGNYYVLAAIDMVIKDVSKIDEKLRVNINTEMETGNSKETIRFPSDLMGIRYLTDEQGKMIKTDDTDNYFTLTETVQTDTGGKKIGDIISGVRRNYSNEANKLKYYNELKYYNDIIDQKLQIPSIFTNSDDEIMEEDVDINESKETGQVTKKQRDKIGNKTRYSVLLTPSVTTDAMLALVKEVLKDGFKLARIIGDKDKKDKKRKDSIEERIHCLIAQMYKDIEVIELDAVNNVKTGPIIRILRELIEMIVYKEPLRPLDASIPSIPEKYNIFIPGDNIVAYKLDELLKNINSRLIIDYSDSSSDETYYPEDVENNGSQGETVSSVYNSQNSQSSQSSFGELSQNSIDIGMYPGFSLSAKPVISKKVTDALSRQTNVPFKKAPKSISSFRDLIREITERLYNLTTTNTRSGKIPPKKILPNKSKILTVIPEDNQQPDFIKNGEKYIWVEVVDGRDHYKKEGDNDEPPTLYFNDGQEIYGPVPELESNEPVEKSNEPVEKSNEPVEKSNEPAEESIDEETETGGKRSPDGKRSPGGKRTRKTIRGKKKTRKTGNKKNKNKKRVSRVNKKRRKRVKTRKNV